MKELFMSLLNKAIQAGIVHESENVYTLVDDDRLYSLSPYLNHNDMKNLIDIVKNPGYISAYPIYRLFAIMGSKLDPTFNEDSNFSITIDGTKYTFDILMSMGMFDPFSDVDFS